MNFLYWNCNNIISCHILRSEKEEISFPLVPFLKRFQQVLRSTFQKLNGYDVWNEKDSDDIAVSLLKRNNA